MNAKLRILVGLAIVLLMTCYLQAQGPVLLGQYDNPSHFSAANYGGTQSIYFSASQNYLATCTIVDYSTINAIISLDGGQTWQTFEVINTGGDPQVRNPSVTGFSGSPVYLFEKRGSTPDAAPWIRHQNFIARDDFGWGGGSFSVTPIGTNGTETDVLDSYIGNMEISSFDNNLWGVVTAHGSSQAGGEYHQFWGSEDGGQTWSIYNKIATSNSVDSLADNYVPDLTYNSADIQYGPNGTILAVGTGQYDFDFQGAEHLWYTFSEDGGKTWSKVQMIPGSENLDVSWSYADRGWNLMIDSNNLFHLFVLAEELDNGWGAYHYTFDGSSWSDAKRFVDPQLIPKGLVAIEADFGDTAPLNAPTLNSDGTLLYSYIDVVDTTGGSNKYELFTVYSKDAGTTWSEPIRIIDNPDFNADEFVDVCREADDDLHVVYCTVDTTGGGYIISHYYQQVDITALMPVEMNPVVINEIMFDVTSDDDATPDVNEGDVNGDGARSVRGDEFIELLNTGDAAIDISGWEFLKRDLTVIFTFPENTLLDPGEFTVVFGGVGPDGFGAQFPPELKIFAANVGDGNLGFAGNDGTSNFRNSDDNVILVNPSLQDTIAELYWGDATPKTSKGVLLAAPNTVGDADLSGSIHQSVTRNPDGTGKWDLHTQASSKGTYQSPGTNIETPFTSIEKLADAIVPESHALYQNYPNPFNPSTTIHFAISKASQVNLTVYDMTGKKVVSLLSDKALSAGQYNVTWDASSVASGIYMYRMQTNDGLNLTRKMVLMK